MGLTTLTVARTLRYLAGGPLSPTLAEDGQRWLIDAADALDGGLLEMCCPVCEETVCDKGCPLSEVRAQYTNG